MNQKEVINRLKIAINMQKDKDLADYLEVDKSTLSNWKSGNRELDYNLLFSKCKQINLHWLLTGEGDIMPGKEVETSINTSSKNLIPFYDDVSTIGGVNTMSASMEGRMPSNEFIRLVYRGDSCDTSLWR